METWRRFLGEEEGRSFFEYAMLFLYFAVTAALALPGVRQRIFRMRISEEIAR